MAYKEYNKNMEDRMKKTPEGEKMLAESKEMMRKVKSMPRRIMTSTGSMVRRAVEKVLPKRTIVIKKKGAIK